MGFPIKAPFSHGFPLVFPWFSYGYGQVSPDHGYCYGHLGMIPLTSRIIPVTDIGREVTEVRPLAFLPTKPRFGQHVTGLGFHIFISNPQLVGSRQIV